MPRILLTSICFFISLSSVNAQKRIVINKIDMWDMNHGEVDSQMIKSGVKKVVTYFANYNCSDSACFKLYEIEEFNRNGQKTYDIMGNDINKDSIFYEVSYKYSPDNILIESDKKMYQSYYVEWGCVYQFDEQGNYVGTRFKIDSTNGIISASVISKYSHDSLGNLVSVNRYSSDGQQIKPSPLYYVDSITVYPNDSVLIPDQSNDTIKTYRSNGYMGSDYLTIYKYSPSKLILKKIIKTNSKDSLYYNTTSVYSYNKLNKLEKITWFYNNKDSVHVDYKISYIDDSVPYRDTIFNEHTIFGFYGNEIRTFDRKGRIIKDEQYPTQPTGDIKRITKYDYNEKGLKVREEDSDYRGTQISIYYYTYY